MELFADNHYAVTDATTLIASARVDLRARHANGAYAGPVIEGTSGYPVDFANNEDADSFVIWGVGAGYRSPEGWRVFLDGRNLGDRTYAANTGVVDSADANSAVYNPGAPRSVYRVHRSNDLRIAADGERLLVVWQTTGGGFAGSGPMVMARSDDGGAHWEPAATPVQGDDTESHGFFALSRAPDGRFHLAWLDSRAGQQGVHHAFTNDTGRSWSAVSTAQPATCECCWNSLAHLDGEAVLLYRDIDPRDMAVASTANGAHGCSGRERVGRFDWDVDGCPHVGGGLAVSTDNALHALVWTGADNHMGVHHLKRHDQGAWSEPERLGHPSARAVDLVATADGGLLAAWDHGSADRTVHVARYQDGRWGTPRALGESKRRPGFPLLTATAEAAQVFWTERGEDGNRTWRFTSIPLIAE
ncbi:exo-alpha-sialidase [Aquisalimonas sp.]|uniref:exo-alpha-sialidase n=1 Tax=Aquisalimonas sp. TaxID=1872621 RepID=UPI0025B877D0|nr:exo-alpha-sialidase [Aquisalimonas sp.]